MRCMKYEMQFYFKEREEKSPEKETRREFAKRKDDVIIITIKGRHYK